MKCVIICGGKATRMGTSCADVPKALTLINGKPLLHYQLAHMKTQGITDIVICAGYLAKHIQQYCGDGSQWDVKITYSIESIPLGTAGAVKLAEVLLLDETFLVVYGDLMINIDIHRLISFHHKHGGVGTIVVHPNDHPFDSDLVEHNAEKQITKFTLKPHSQEKIARNITSAAMYLLEPTVLSMIPQNVNCDFVHDIFPKLVKKKMQLYAYNTSEYLKDMGTSERLAQVAHDVAIGKVERMTLRIPRKAIFLDRDGVLVEYQDLITHHKELLLLPGVTDAIKVINKSEYLAIVVTNQPSIAKGMCTEANIEKQHAKLDTLLGRAGVKLDAIYHCPHHPEKGFQGENKAFKIACECRKPAPGMLLNAAKEFNLDLSGSFIIGDSTVDIAAGKAAGVRSLGVQTGWGLNDGKIAITPERMFQNVYEAVKWIVQGEN